MAIFIVYDRIKDRPVQHFESKEEALYFASHHRYAENNVLSYSEFYSLLEGRNRARHRESQKVYIGNKYYI